MQSRRLTLAAVLTIGVAHAASAQQVRDVDQLVPASQETFDDPEIALAPLGNLERSASAELSTSREDGYLPLTDPQVFTEFAEFAQASPGSSEPYFNGTDSGGTEAGNPERFSGRFSNDSPTFDVGLDLYSPPDFEGGLIVYGDRVAIKVDDPPVLRANTTVATHHRLVVDETVLVRIGDWVSGRSEHWMKLWLQSEVRGIID